tara:strand:+ start:579 stop:1277 length:699 start_codon:yes stop_codon:yes gene_type:complete
VVKLKDLLYEKKDHEGSMAKSQLERSKEYAMMIYKIIQNVDKDGDGEVEFPAWVQSKLTKAEDYLQSVYNYLDGKDGLDDKFQDEASSTANVPGYQTPHAFKKSTKAAINWDDEDDDDEILGGLLDKRKKRVKRFGEAPMGTQLKYSTPEAKTFVEKDVRQMGKLLNKASQQSIKVMLSGVKSGKYDAMDLIRGIKEGPAVDTSVGVRSMLQVLWGKVEKRFRQYLGGKKRR